MATNHNSSRVVFSSTLEPAPRSRAVGDWKFSAARRVEQQTSHCYLSFLLDSDWKEKGQQSTRVYNKLMVTSTMLHQIKKINKPIYISKTIQSDITVQGTDKGLMFFSSRSLAEVFSWCNSKSLQPPVQNLFYEKCTSGPSAVPSGLQPRNI